MSIRARIAHAARWSSRFACLLVPAAVVLGALGLSVPTARAEFGFERADVTITNQEGYGSTGAGSHPLGWTTSFMLNTISDSGKEVPEQALKDLRVHLPPGLVGTPSLLPRCSHVQFQAEACPADTAIGEVVLYTESAETEDKGFPVYNLVPLTGSAAEFGFIPVHLPVVIKITVNPEPPNNLVASIGYASQFAAFFGSTLTIGGMPGGRPLLTLPRSCSGPLESRLEAVSWQRPSNWVVERALAREGSEPLAPLSLGGCDGLGFSPQLSTQPTVVTTQSATGLDLSIDVDDRGLTEPGSRAQSDIRKAVFVLPEGMTINPSLASGLEACTVADLERETPVSAPGEGCPDASKIGRALVDTPLLEDPLVGSVFIAQPDRSTGSSSGEGAPSDAPFAAYVVFKSAARGVVISQVARIEPDPISGQLSVTLDQIPQLPFTHLELHLRDGARSPLRSPPDCGNYASRYELTPWSGMPPLTGVAAFEIDRGCRPGGFDPHLSAGVTRPVSGASSPFVFDLSRRDGEQNPFELSITLPPGLDANFAGIPLCANDLSASGACPAGSRVGTAQIAAGSGEKPLWIPTADGPQATVYLAGPFEGAPFSFVMVVPVQAGPFDLGTIITRAAIYIDPETAQAKIHVDPLPQILGGVPIAYRTIRLVLDRPGFVRNPTSCAPTAVHAGITSVAGTVATPSDRFQVGECGRLPFKPRLSMRLLGPTRRGAHPRLRIALTSRPGDANLRRVAVTLPGTQLLDTRRIGDVCSRAEFAVDSCPPASVYGHAKVWTPLLDRPLEGSVYLRASKSRLPELAFALEGQIDLDLTARLDSTRGRLRNTFEALPDTPLRKVVLTMAGGKNGLLVNGGGLCSRPRRLQAAFLAHSGKHRRAHPVVATDCRS